MILNRISAVKLKLSHRQLTELTVARPGQGNLKPELGCQLQAEPASGPQASGSKQMYSSIHLQVAQVILRNIDEYWKWMVILMNIDMY